jgi:kynureninase
MTTRADCARLDDTDALAPLRDQFQLPDETIYLDGNSLGPLPITVAARLQRVVAHEWGTNLIGSWNSADWMRLPHTVGNKIGSLLGAGDGELIVTDSTSVNLFKVLDVAASISGGARDVILSERDNFPTDLYIAGSVAAAHGMTLELAERGSVATMLDERVAILLLTHVDYRTGAMHDMAATTAAAHAAGAVVVWDLAHSAGAVPVDLHAADADFAVGCGYKFLNGGPGAPGFLWVHPRHHGQQSQPLAGWMGHAAPFDFTPDYRPAIGIAGYQAGTPPILSLAALDCGVDTVLAAANLGGIAALRAKSLALSELLIELVEPVGREHGLTVVTPRDPTKRGSQVSLSHPANGFALMQALIARGVVGDFRAPDVLRFGCTPLYTRYVDIYDAVDQLAEVLGSGEWRRPEFSRRGLVT